MEKTSSTHKNGNNANTVLAGRCLSCKFWIKNEDSEHAPKDMGECVLMSGKFIKDSKEFMGKKYEQEQYPDTEKTGIESYPICVHDGSGFYYTTKSWFGCVHYNAR
jgi:hypothetical protein